MKQVMRESLLIKLPVIIGDLFLLNLSWILALTATGLYRPLAGDIRLSQHLLHPGPLVVRRDPLLADRPLRGDHPPRILRRTLPPGVLRAHPDRMELRAAAGAPDGDVLHRAHHSADAVALHLPHRGQGHARTRPQRPPRDHRRKQGQCGGGIPRNGRQHQHGLPRARLFQQPRRPHPAGQHPLPG